MKELLPAFLRVSTACDYSGCPNVHLTFSFLFDGLRLRHSEALHSFIFLVRFLVLMAVLFGIR